MGQTRRKSKLDNVTLDQKDYGEDSFCGKGGGRDYSWIKVPGMLVRFSNRSVCNTLSACNGHKCYFVLISFVSQFVMWEARWPNG